MKIINNHPGLKVVNLASLPRGTGAKYLEVLESHCGTLIAVQWRRVAPKSLPEGRALVVLGGKP